MRKIINQGFPVAALSVSIAGFAFFYLIPFVISSVYAFMDNPVRMQFTGMKNLIELLDNRFFLMGMKNTFLFMLAAIPLGIAASLLLALALKPFKRFVPLLSVIFLIPLVLPSAVTARFWMRIFSENGLLNELLSRVGIAGPGWMDGGYAMGTIIVIYVWKNLGYNMVLFMAGLNNIPADCYDCASVLGAGPMQRFRYITLTYLTPTFLLVFIMSFVNAFKIFREVYLIWNEYPPESVYLLQYFVNNTLLSLHYHKLVGAVYILTAVIVLVVAVTLHFERRISRELSS